MTSVALPERAVLGNYEIRAVLGHGGGGISYLAYDTQLEREVVLKEHFPRTLCMRRKGDAEVLPVDESDYARSLAAFCREARILAGLNHPGVVKVHDIFQAAGTAYMVMEYVEGESLQVWLEAHAAEPPLVEQVLQQLLLSLDYIHSCGVLHRDVKPGNIVVKEGHVPVLIDFGAAMLGEAEATHTLVGSPGYAPPEQFQPHGNIGPWSDLYALAHSFLACIPREAMKQYRAVWVQSLLRAGEQMADKRFASAAEWSLVLQKKGGKKRQWCVVGLVAVLGVAAVLASLCCPGDGETLPVEVEENRPQTEVAEVVPATTEMETTRLAREAHEEYTRRIQELERRVADGDIPASAGETAKQDVLEAYRRRIMDISAAHQPQK